MKNANALHGALARLTSFACLGAGLFALSAAASAQNIGTTGELGTAGRPGELQIAGRIVCPGGPASLGRFQEVTGMQPVKAGSSVQGREASLGKVTGIDGYVRHEPPTSGPWSLGRFDEIDGLQLIPNDRVCSTQGREASIGTVTQVDGFVRHEPQTDGPWSLGRVKLIKLGPLPGAEPLVEEEAVADPMRTVALYGRSGVEYALFVLPMGSSSGPAILIGRGMLFGTDPSEEPRKYMLQVPSELGVLLVRIP